jgi:hypothetical protein
MLFVFIFVLLDPVWWLLEVSCVLTYWIVDILMVHQFFSGRPTGVLLW